MPAKTKRPSRAKINCQYLQTQDKPVRFVRPVDGEFTCPGCGSVLRQGGVFYCDICASELGPCCHPDFSDAHRNHRCDVDDLEDYLPPVLCNQAGDVRCMCCNRMLCMQHARKADLSRLSLEEELGKVVLCPNCKYTLDPLPEDEEFDFRPPVDRFEDEYELQNFLRQNNLD